MDRLGPAQLWKGRTDAGHAHRPRSRARAFSRCPGRRWPLVIREEAVMYFDERNVRELLQKVLGYSQAGQTEVVYLGVESALTRFANNYIHQNVAESNHELRVRAVVGKRTGVASTNRLDDESLHRVVDQALEIARLQPENPEFHSLPVPRPPRFAPPYTDATAGL